MRMFGWIRQLCCRHEDVLRFEDTRLRLECLACGRVTHGFDGLGRATRVAHRHPVVAQAHAWPGALHRAA